MKTWNPILIFITIFLFVTPALAEEIDPSDPNKIYTYAGGGVKYTDYTNGESMTEIRTIGNIAASENDMVLFEVGYGWHDGDRVTGGDSGLTNGRLRWFHLLSMDYTAISGYRGWSTQIDLQLAGSLKGTNGPNTITVGVMPAFGINERLSASLAIGLMNTWDKDFEKHLGTGVNFSPLLVYSPDYLWGGAFVQFWPGYSYFFSGDLENAGSGNLDITIGGPITNTVIWAVTYQKLFDKNLKSLRRGNETGLNNDWNVFANITTYF